MHRTGAMHMKTFQSTLFQKMNYAEHEVFPLGPGASGHIGALFGVRPSALPRTFVSTKARRRRGRGRSWRGSKDSRETGRWLGMTLPPPPLLRATRVATEVGQIWLWNLIRHGRTSLRARAMMWKMYCVWPATSFSQRTPDPSGLVAVVPAT